MSACDNCGQPIETTGETGSLCEPCTTLSERRTPIRLRPAEPGDLELMLAWRSNPKIYRYFREQDGPLDWEAHKSWYESREPDQHDFIIHYEGRRVGAVSLSSDDDISIYLGDFSAHGRGVAKATLGWMCERFADRSPLFAEIYDDNTSSIQLFRSCGFDQCGRNGEWKQYEYVADI